MTDDAERWKEKYLKSIEQQEKLERRWDARLDLLRLPDALTVDTLPVLS